MPRKITNPFKQQRNVWVHYIFLILIAFALTALVVLSGSTSTPQEDPLDRTASGGAERKTRHEYIVGANNELEVEADVVKPQKTDDRESGDESEDEEEIDKAPVFKEMSQRDFPLWVHEYYKSLKWPEPPQGALNAPKTLTRDILLESLQLGCTNIAENQHDAGNFNYQYNFVTKQMDHDDNEVRQAGALWGLAMCFQFDPSNEKYLKGTEKGIQFFMDHSVSDEGTIRIRYPNDRAPTSNTGTNALFALTMIEYLRTITGASSNKVINVDAEFVDRVKTNLAGVVRHLQQMQLPNKHFAERYIFSQNKKSQNSSPYMDGETMLCLVKAAKYIDGYAHLIPMIEDAAPVLAKTYTIDAWAKGVHDSDQTKGFYQWSSMFLTEYHHAGWSNAEMFGDFVIMLGHWIIHTHEILYRKRNTGYAYEGIISAYEIAKSRGLEAATSNFEATIDKGLHSLCTWQVGSPLAHENRFLVEHPTTEAIAIGGVMNAKNEAPLRIDTTQHQMHALMMALASVYKS